MKVGDRVRDNRRPHIGAGTVIRIDTHPAAEVVIDVRFDDERVSTYFQFDDLTATPRAEA